MYAFNVGIRTDLSHVLASQQLGLGPAGELCFGVIPAMDTKGQVHSAKYLGWVQIGW